MGRFSCGILISGWLTLDVVIANNPVACHNNLKRGHALPFAGDGLYAIAMAGVGALGLGTHGYVSHYAAAVMYMPLPGMA